MDSDDNVDNGRIVLSETNNTITIVESDGERAVISGDGIVIQDSAGVPIAGRQLQPVVGNGLGGTNEGQLSSIQIGQMHWQLPQLSAGVAEALPGLTEDLGGAPAQFLIGRLFYGIEQSQGVQFTSTPTANTFPLPGVTVPLGATAVDLDRTVQTTTITLTSNGGTLYNLVTDATPQTQTGDLPEAGIALDGFTVSTGAQVVAYNPGLDDNNIRCSS